MIRKTLMLLLASLFVVSANAQVGKFEYEEIDETPINSKYVEIDEDDNGLFNADLSYRLSLGPKVGFNYVMGKRVDVVNNTAFDAKGGAGFNAGLAFNAHFGRRSISSKGGTGWIGLQLEALYSNKAIKVEDEKIGFHSFEIPVLAQCYLIPNLYVEVGPTFTGSFAHPSSKQLIKNGDVYSVGQIKAYDVMLSVGLGYKSKGGFMVNARYNLGNSKLAGNFPIKMSTLTVSVGWLFNVAK